MPGSQDASGSRLEGVCANKAAVGDASSGLNSRRLAQRGFVSYCVIGETRKGDEDRRKEHRRPVRLQSGKVIDGKGRFLVDCLFRNRAASGSLLRLCRHIQLPARFVLYDDNSRTAALATLAWQRGCEAGCRLSFFEPAFGERLRNRFDRRYYAVR